ncbi:MAG: sulfite exporter TauE/SafE family protein [Acidobacteria bacterium]|nr:sulfite exporter TauE/SafE family protein [Acidobacteriota bacterium]
MTLTDAALNFTLGLAGSLHCVSMCGPIVLSWSLSGPNRPSSHFAYHAGRIATYGVLGAIAGSLGQAVSSLGSLARLQNAAAVVAGALMVVAGLLLLGAIRRPALIQIAPVAGLTRRAARLLNNTSLISRLRMGLLMGILPCGLVYAALLKAMAPANAWDGAVTMVMFGLGTAGSLLGLGIFSTVFSKRINQWGVPVTAVAVALMGVALLIRGLMPMAVTGSGHMHHH